MAKQKRKRYPTIEDMQIMAAKKNGKCKSTVYVDSQTHLIWECDQHHEWPATPNTIQRGRWCPECAKINNPGNSKHTIEDAKAFAKTKNGECLSNEYVSSSKPLIWRCKEGHEWPATFHSVKGGSWCTKCFQLNVAGRYHADTLENMQLIASKRGGKCLAAEYKNSITPIPWQCAEGHIWMNAPYHIKAGQWCPDCMSFRGERTYRAFISHIMQKHFVKIRPEWLGGLEIDGYNEELQMGFEFQGVQHFKFTPMFHDTPEDLIKQQERDVRKKSIVDARGIKMLYPTDKMKHTRIVNYTIDTLDKLSIAPMVDPKTVVYKDFIT